MASLPEPQFEEERGKFDAEQQKLLETIADTNPEEVLEAAEKRIGVLIKGTKERIEGVFKSEKVSHVLLFQSALAKERRKPGASEGAFGRAFEAVYGRFLFEQQNEDVKNPHSRFVRMLSKVLSNRIEAPDGPVDAAERKSLIALRSELQAVAKRLHMLDASATVKVGDKKVKVADRLKDIEVEKAKLEGSLNNASTAKSSESDSIRQQIVALEEETRKISELWGHKIAEKMEKAKGEAKKKIANLENEKARLESERSRVLVEKNEFKRQLTDADSRLQKAEKACEDGDLVTAKEALSVAIAERDAALAKIAEIDEKISKLSTEQESYRVTFPDRLDSKLKELDGAESAHLKAISDADSRIRELNDQIANFIRSNTQLDGGGLTADEIEGMTDSDIEKLQKKDKVAFARALFGFKPASVITANAVFRKHAALKAKFEPNDYNESDGAQAKAKRMQKLITEAFQILIDAIAAGNSGPISDTAAKLKSLKKELKDAEGQKARLEARKQIEIIEATGIFATLDDLARSVNDLSTGSGDARLKAICDEYIEAYERSIKASRDAGTLEKKDIVAFNQGKLKPLFSSIVARLGTLISELQEARGSQNLDDLNSKVSSREDVVREAEEKLKLAESTRDSLRAVAAKLGEDIESSNDKLKALEAEISAVNKGIDSQNAILGMKPSDWVLEQALPGVKIEGNVVKIRGFETNFKHVAKVLKAAQDYFNSPEEMQKLNDKLQEIAPLIESNKTILTDEENQKLEEMGVKFSADQSLSSKIKALETVLDLLKGQRNRQGDQRETVQLGVKLAATLEKLREIKVGSDEIYAEMKKLADHLKVVQKAGIKLDGVEDTDVSDLISNVPPKASDFHIQKLVNVQAVLKSFFESGTNVSNFADSIRKAQEEIAKSTNLSDAAAAKKLLGVMIAEQNPDMNLPDQQKLASMILANDVATIQTEASYAELAKRGSAEKLETVQQAGFKRKLIGFQYKEGDKTVAPFKGLKPEQFNDWAEIERLFKIGRLNHQNGFFVLAAMKEFAPTADGQPVPQIQAVKLEKKLKAALAEELGVDERMDEAGIDKILNKAFADQMKKAEQLVKAYFQHFERNKGEWNGNKIKELNLRYARVREELRLGKINDATFQKRMAELVEEAKETEVLDQVKFSEDSAMAGYWDSPFSQWFRDRGWDIGQYAKGKAKSVALSGVKLGAFGLWGATKLGLSATLQTALLPLRAVKYPLLLAAKPLVGVINLFRRQKWTPLPKIRDAVRSDAGRVVGYFTTKGGETLKGAVEKGIGVPKAEWGKTPYAGKQYKERTKVDLAALKEQADELKVKGDATPVEVAGSPFIDLKKYRDEIAKLDRILAQKPAEERGGSASGEARAAA